jgi:hypothetical protein
MKRIPKTKGSLVLRTHFSNEAVWKALCEAIVAPVGEFQAYVEFVSDAEYEAAPIEALVKLASPNRSFMFVVDRLAIESPDHAVLIVDLTGEPGRSFRVVPQEMWSVENNLSLANMGFEEFADAVDDDGVFRGFADS